MGSAPTLMYLRSVSSQKDREEAFARRSSGLLYFLAAIPFYFFMPYIVAYDLFRASS